MSRHPWRRVAAGMFAVAWGGNAFTPLLVMYRQESGFSTAQVDLLLAAYVLGIVPALLIGGPMSDRHGRRPLMWPAPVVAALGSAVLALGADSVPVLFLGRVLCGVALGLAMAVGTSWVKELSQAPHDPGADSGSGARRASLALTFGFLAGAGLAGSLSQWAPHPTVLPYLLHVVVSVPCLLLVLGAPETHPGRATQGLRADLRVPSAGRLRFWLVVAPAAPWVFTCLSVGYAVVPGLMLDELPGVAIAFSTLLTAVLLTAGVLVQPLAKRLDRPGSVRAIAVGLGLTAAGVVVAAVAADLLAVAVAVLTALVLGLAYGTGLVSGLQEVQRIATPRDLAGLTAVYYGLGYLGFGVPVLLAVVHETTGASYPLMLGVLAGVGVACLAVVVGGRRTPVPPAEPVPASRVAGTR